MTAACQHFLYPALEERVPGSFRLVTLYPGERDQAIICDLAQDNWEEGGTVYEALSYAWGDLSGTKSIQLNGHDFKVTGNLYSALSHLRFKDKIRTLWIDAICINQDDLEERNRQVLYMGEIYLYANLVVVWLGESDDDSDDAIFFMNSLYNLVGGGWSISTGGGGPHKAPRKWLNNETLLVYLDPQYAHLWKKVCRLIQREWWQRAWVVQEFINAGELVFQVGTRMIDWTLLSNFINFIQSAVERWPSMSLTVGSASGVVMDAYDLMYYRKYKSSDGIEFQKLLCSQRHRKCANPLDKIFSLLSLTKERYRKTFAPDYSRSATWLYGMVVRACSDSSGDLEILCESMSFETSRSFPSWCPDWSMPRVRSQLGGDPKASKYRVSGLSPSLMSRGKVRFSEDMQTLFLKEFHMIDTVAKAGLQRSDEDFQWNNHGNEPGCNWNLLIVAETLAEEGTSVRDYTGHSNSSVELIHRALLCTLVADLMQIDGKIQRKLTFDMDPKTDFEWPFDREKYFQQARDRTWGRTLVLSRKGLLGLTPRGTQEGDCIFVIPGCSVPIIMRRREDGAYSWIGDSYIHGIMDGYQKVQLGKSEHEQKEEIMVR